MLAEVVLEIVCRFEMDDTSVRLFESRTLTT